MPKHKYMNLGAFIRGIIVYNEVRDAHSEILENPGEYGVISLMKGRFLVDKKAQEKISDDLRLKGYSFREDQKDKIRKGNWKFQTTVMQQLANAQKQRLLVLTPKTEDALPVDRKTREKDIEDLTARLMIAKESRRTLILRPTELRDSYHIPNKYISQMKFDSQAIGYSGSEALIVLQDLLKNQAAEQNSL